MRFDGTSENSTKWSFPKSFAPEFPHNALHETDEILGFFFGSRMNEGGFTTTKKKDVNVWTPKKTADGKHEV